uniref:Oxidoreductase FAD/NAD(P)-binding domain-containing protein n=1 Tax=Attheya septentrionalis TaxID=420275 RepID=A0A7S2XS23_9STRA
MAAAGSGMAPLKACIESGLFSCASSGTTTLYYGEWTEDDLCFTDLHDNWRNYMGITVVPVLSRTPDTRGYIQEVLQQDGLATRTTDIDNNNNDNNNDNAMAIPTTWAILCGMDDMVESCTKVLTSAGMDDQRILLNLS